jgi:hypothetical protein
VPIVVSDSNGCNLCLPPADKHGHLLLVRLCLLQAGVCRSTVASAVQRCLRFASPLAQRAPDTRVRRIQK